MIIIDENGQPLPRDEQFKIMVNELGESRESANLMLAFQFDGVTSDIEVVDEDSD